MNKTLLVLSKSYICYLIIVTLPFIYLGCGKVSNNLTKPSLKKKGKEEILSRMFSGNSQKEMISVWGADRGHKGICLSHVVIYSIKKSDISISWDAKAKSYLVEVPVSGVFSGFKTVSPISEAHFFSRSILKKRERPGINYGIWFKPRNERFLNDEPYDWEMIYLTEDVSSIIFKPLKEVIEIIKSRKLTDKFTDDWHQKIKRNYEQYPSIDIKSNSLKSNYDFLIQNSKKSSADVIFNMIDAQAGSVQTNLKFDFFVKDSDGEFKIKYRLSSTNESGFIADTTALYFWDSFFEIPRGKIYKDTAPFWEPPERYR